MPTPQSPPVLRRQVGGELRRLRERDGHTVAEIARRLGWSESKLSRVETAHTGIRRDDLEKLLDLYGVPAQDRLRLTEQASRSRQRAWWKSYGDVPNVAYETLLAFEAEAVKMSTYQVQLVPGLLQTAEYAKAAIEADGGFEPRVVDRLVAVRLARQTVLVREPRPHFHLVLDEAMLHRPIGGAGVFRRQLLRLLEATQSPMIVIQVIPFDVGAHGAMTGSFSIYEFDEPINSPLIYCEGRTGGVLRTKDDDVRAYTSSFSAISAAALSPDRSADLIAERARSYAA